MSKKQQEHKEQYNCSTLLIDEETDEETESSDNKTTDSDDLSKSNVKYTLWDDLMEMKDTLRDLGDIKKVRKYIKENMVSEVDEIVNEFHKQFDDVEEDDDLKIEVLILLAELGITIYKPPKKD